MNYDERTLLNRLNKLGLNRINLRDIYVTILYMEYLEDMQAFLMDANYNNGLRNILGNDYRLVQPALEDPQILVNLCRKFNGDYALQAILQDTMYPICRPNKSPAFFTPTIELTLNPQQQITQLHTQFLDFCKTDAYVQYCQNTLFDDDVFDIFRNTYVRTFQVFPTILKNYKNSIRLCCQRVIMDWNDINQFFLPQQNITHLVEIESTGSDTHKGGLEVLILTFNYQQQQPLIGQHRNLLKVVYKPRDIEIDALICGNSVSLRNIGCLANNLSTLFDYLNVEIANYNQANNANIQPLFTYKFLPKQYGSLSRNNLQNSYGYVEFLPYEDEDYNIQQTNDPEVVAKFYISIGMLMATTALFSMCDIHKDNLRVCRYQPCLVDLENSLVNRCTDLQRIGFVLQNDFSSLRGVAQNRLYDGDNLIRPEDNVWYIETGFNIMSQIIYNFANTNNNADLWFGRLPNVVSRQIPISTRILVEKQRVLYNFQNCTQPVKNIPTERDQYFRNKELECYNAWHTSTVGLLEEDENDFIQSTNDWKIAYWSQNRGKIILPTFLPYNQNYISQEFDALDVPSYYHHLYTQNLVDYTGAQVQATPPNYVQQDHLTTFSRLMVSTVYFCYPNNLSPTQVIIQYQLRVDRTTFQQNIEAFIQQLHDFLW